MSEEKKTNAENAAPLPKKKGLRIREFIDLRLLRTSYRKSLNASIGVDPVDPINPSVPGDAMKTDEGEEDFGLKRSTPEEAWEFFRESQKKDDSPDDLTEFINDK